MAQPTIPTNIDDAFVAGWYFGRGKTHQPIAFPRSTPVHISREYERGVYEGMQFENKWTPTEPGPSDPWNNADCRG